MTHFVDVAYILTRQTTIVNADQHRKYDIMVTWKELRSSHLQANMTDAPVIS